MCDKRYVIWVRRAGGVYRAIVQNQPSRGLHRGPMSEWMHRQHSVGISWIVTYFGGYPRGLFKVLTLKCQFDFGHHQTAVGPMKLVNFPGVSANLDPMPRFLDHASSAKLCDNFFCFGLGDLVLEFWTRHADICAFHRQEPPAAADSDSYDRSRRYREVSLSIRRGGAISPCIALYEKLVLDLGCHEQNVLGTCEVPEVHGALEL